MRYVWGLLFTLLALPLFASAAPAVTIDDPGSWLRASPNPCVLRGAPTCTVTLSYLISDPAWDAQLWVSSDGGNETLMACSAHTGSADAAWIQPGHVYVFRLYRSRGCAVAGRSGGPVASVGVSGITNDLTPPAPGIGTDAYNLVQQYLGRMNGFNGSDAERAVYIAMAQKSLADARAAGSTYARVMVAGYDPHDLDLWRTDPVRYWAIMDQLFSDLHKYNMRIVPEFVLYEYQFPLLTGESFEEMLTNTDSASYRLLTQYVHDFISRYKNDPSIYFYELFNELSLGADVINTASGYNTRYSTNQMIGFSSTLAAYIRSLDSSHMISSGYSLRPSASHLRANPVWNGGDWTADSPAEMQQWVADVHQGLDIMSIHYYQGDNYWFGNSGYDNVENLRTFKSIADATGKLLFVGEFGDFNAPLANPSFSKAVINKVVELRIPYAAPWVWEVYQWNTYEPADGAHFHIEPGYSDPLIDAIRTANTQMGNAPAVFDTPRVVLTWPIDGGSVAQSQLVHAVASSADGRSVARVEFVLDGAVVATVTTPPYQFTLQRSLVASGIHRLVARAYDASGKDAEDGVTIKDGVVNNAAVVPSTCTPNWSCTGWSQCPVSGSQSRTCTDLNACGVSTGKPVESQSCTYSNGGGGGGGEFVPVTPSSTSTATSTTQTTAQKIAALLIQIQQLQALLTKLRGGGTVVSPPPQTKATVTYNGTCPVLSRALSRGMKGADVTALQKFFFSKYEGFPSPTGFFGPTTEAALKQWQSEHGIESIGSVGPKTRAAIAACK